MWPWPVGVEQVLGGHRERAGRLAEGVEVGGEVEVEDRVGGAAGEQARSRRATRHRSRSRRPPARWARASPASAMPSMTSESTGPCTVLRTVIALVGAAGDLDDLLRGSVTGCQVAVAQVGVADDPLEVEVGDVGAEVGEAPGDVGVVADDDPGHAREGETADVIGQDSDDRAAGQAVLDPDAGLARRPGAGRWRAAACRWWCASRRRPTSSNPRPPPRPTSCGTEVSAACTVAYAACADGLVIRASAGAAPASDVVVLDDVVVRADGTADWVARSGTCGDHSSLPRIGGWASCVVRRVDLVDLAPASAGRRAGPGRARRRSCP